MLRSCNFPLPGGHRRRPLGFPAQNVTLLRSRQANRAAVLDAITDLADADRVKPGDRALIYFSGHGRDIPLPNRTRLGLLLPSDAKVSLGKPNPAEYLRTCLRMDEIQSILKLTPAKHTVVTADACFSGLLAGPRQASAESGLCSYPGTGGPTRRSHRSSERRESGRQAAHPRLRVAQRRTLYTNCHALIGTAIAGA